MTKERNNLQSRADKLEHALQEHTQKVAELAAKEQQRRQLERDLDIAGCASFPQLPARQADYARLPLY